MNQASLYLRLWARPILFGSIACVLAAGIAAGAKMYAETRQLEYYTSPDRMFGITPYAAYMTIYSFDPAARTMDVVMRSRATNENLMFRLWLSPSFKVERQDPIIKDNVWVGIGPKESASLGDLAPGVHGIGVLQWTQDNKSQIEYLLIGDPFPRP